MNLGVVEARRTLNENKGGPFGAVIVDKDNRNEFFKSIEGRYKTHTAQKILSRINIAKNAFLNNVEK